MLKRSKKKVVLMLENKLGFDFINILRVRLDRIYFAETENRKHYNEIIFKCVNSAVRSIFNEKVSEK